MSKLIIVNVSYGILDILLSSFLVSYLMRSFTNQIVGVAVFALGLILMAVPLARMSIKNSRDTAQH